MLKKFALSAATLLTVLAVGPATQAQQKNSFRIVNNSSWRINEVYVALSASDNWGPDRLRGYMYPNQYLDLNMYDGYYDVKVVDKDNDSCVITRQHLYGGTVWTLDNTKLLSCEVLTALK